jgi:hypothetical protein
MLSRSGPRSGGPQTAAMLNSGNADEQIVGVGAVLESSPSGPLQVSKLVPGGPAQVPESLLLHAEPIKHDTCLG